MLNIHLMDLKVNSTKQLTGLIYAPGSKSYSHRAFIAAAFAEGPSMIRNALTTGDVEVTMNILRELGINILKETQEGLYDSYMISQTKNFLKPTDKIIDCKNSGTSIRIFSALSLLIEGGLSFTGEFLKRKRPIIPLLDSLKNLGGTFKFLENSLKIERTENICDIIKIQGDISSQFITALLFVSSLLKCQKKGPIEIQVTTPLVSYPYIQITLDVLRSFGVNLVEKIDGEKKGKYIITCAQNLRSQLYEIPGDFSSCAFLIAAACLSPELSDITINNLNYSNPQGDKKIIEILQNMGANIILNHEDNSVHIKSSITSYPLEGLKIDCSDIPDLFPILSVIGAFAKGSTVLFNASTVRLKESDRISVMARELTKMGATVEEREDKLTIFHCEKLRGIEVNHENDHRIAMACCIASLYCETPSYIKNIEIIRDSYPKFAEDLKTLQAQIELI